MGDKSAIEWTDATWNPSYGCTKVSAECAYCYINRTPPYRMAGLDWDSNASIPIQLHYTRLELPLHWVKPRRIFPDSLSDLFHQDVPDSFIAQVYAVMAMAKWHTFQMLTKRPERRRALLASDSFQRMVEHYFEMLWQSRQWPRDRKFALDVHWPLPNVWEGITAGTQTTFDQRWPILGETLAAVRWLSGEPLLTDLNLEGALYCHCGERIGECGHNEAGLDWVVIGGESGAPAARSLVEPCLPAKSFVGLPTMGICTNCQDRADGRNCYGTGWRPKVGATERVRALRDQCVEHGVPFLFKQWGGPKSKSGGRMLDGRTWDEYPEVAA